VRQVVILGEQTNSRKQPLDLDATFATLQTVCPDCCFYHRGLPISADPSELLRSIPRIGVIEYRSQKSRPRPALAPTVAIPISIIDANTGAIRTLLRDPNATLGAVIADDRPRRPAPLALESLDSREPLDPALPIRCLPEPRDVVVVEPLSLSVTDRSGAERAVVVSPRAALSELCPEADDAIADGFGRIVERALPIHDAVRRHGSAFVIVLRDRVRSVRVSGGDGERTLPFNGDATALGLRTAIAVGRGIFAAEIALSGDRGPIADDGLVRDIGGVVRVSQKQAVRKQPDYGSKLELLVHSSGRDRRECSRSFNCHDYDSVAALADLRRGK
jgi:hypothetical protein